EANIGRAEAARVFAALADAGAAVVDLPPAATAAPDAAAAVRPRLAGGDFAGVVLLGGYDVVPPHRLDVIDAPTRQRLVAAGQVRKDRDAFYVWSDELYADADGDALPELPLTRIPDGRRADVVFAALSAPAFAA